jgi:NADPH-dependent 2,4-dienoyl-CoA reductase/sulfur reductase-like enzyme
VLGINHKIREITCRNIVTNETSKLNYDTLIFATGSMPSKPPIAGVDNKNVFVLRTIDDAQRIIQYAKSVKSVAIIGASFIGLEVAEALKHLGLKITIIEQRYLLWRMLDKEISALVRQRLLDDGFGIVENKTISDVNDYKDAMVIVSTGVKPQVKLAKEIGVEIGSTGGIKVDRYLRTNLSDVYAVGDCAESVSELTGEPIVIGLGTIAARQGVVAGANATGSQETGPLIVNASVLKILDMEIGSAGLIEDYFSIPRNLSFKPISALIKYPSLPHYYPGGSDIHIKLIADKETKHIIGGQVLCKSGSPEGEPRPNGGAAQRVNMISLIIQNTMIVNDLLKSDFCYSPPVTDIWEPIIIAAQALTARLNRT